MDDVSHSACVRMRIPLSAQNKMESKNSKNEIETNGERKSSNKSEQRNREKNEDEAKRPLTRGYYYGI